MEKKTNSKVQIRYSGSFVRHWYWCVMIVLLLLLLTAVTLYVDTLAGCIVGGFTVAAFAAVIALEIYYRPRVLAELMDFSNQFSNVEKDLLRGMVIPAGLVQPDGKMLWMNAALAELAGKGEHYHKSISNLFAQLTPAAFPADDKICSMELDYEEKKFQVIMEKVSLAHVVENLEGVEADQEDCYMIAVYFLDNTELFAYRRENQELRPVIGLLYIDNYDEVMENTEEIRRSMLEALVDRRITKYTPFAGGIIKKMEDDKYLLVLSRRGLTQMQEDRFSILEDVKNTNIGKTMNMTISIGIGTENGDYAGNYEAARVAIEMALARGGDQAVVKDKDKISYYGGKTQRTESNARVQVRVKAQAIRELMIANEQVIVMGHKLTDIDSLGAAIGMVRAARHVGRPAYIVLEDDRNVKIWAQMLRSSKESQEEGLFLKGSEAIRKTSPSTVVIVVDTNRPSMVECKDILYLTKTIVVVDHHRRAADWIENASISYVDPNSSSACEMITELLQYFDESIRLKPVEADCLYAGIVVDTNNFVAKTGMRTFEAAAYLRRSGADMSRVRKAFRENMATYKARAEAVRCAEIYMDCFAISTCPGQDVDCPTVVGAQAANELLNIVGVKASFVLTEFGGEIYISARAIDEVNVQIIMERLGGGGHMNIAGAQLSCSMEEAKIKLKELLTQMVREGAI